MIAAAQCAGTWTWLGFAPSDLATVAAAIVGAAIAAVVVVAGYRHQQNEQRRGQRATLYAEALRAVEDYLEAPYLIARRDGSHQARMHLVEHISDIQSRIAFYQAHMSIHAPTPVCEAYAEFVTAARREAGLEMTSLWKGKPTRKDSQVPLGARFARPLSDAARDEVARAMRHDIQPVKADPRR
ncbi:MAG TPA: hypothetical protein VGC37_08700 [Friedmanniella sp.]